MESLVCILYTRVTTAFEQNVHNVLGATSKSSQLQGIYCKLLSVNQ